MIKLTKEQAVIISGFTGYLCCKFSDLHAEIERKLGRAVFVHETPRCDAEIKKAFESDFLAICHD